MNVFENAVCTISAILVMPFFPCADICMYKYQNRFHYAGRGNEIDKFMKYLNNDDETATFLGVFIYSENMQDLDT